MDQRPLLISDLDGVLCETAADGLLWVWWRYGVVVPVRAVRRYAMEHAIAPALQASGIDVGPEEVAAELTASCWSNPAFYRAVRPRSDYWQALLRWQARGLPLQLVTRRTEDLRHATASWLVQHGFAVTGAGPLSARPPLVMNAPKAEVAAEACASHERVIFVEDAPHHAEAVAAASSAEVWMPAQPWNADCKVGRRLPAAELAEDLVALAER